ncbi:MAG: hypothetical protein DPW16_11100 [Chloroflexi bacterium]|nr:hypothetical protein [Chloroflexota bacterium]
MLLSHPLWLPKAYYYLDVSESPVPADVIIVLGGGDGQRETFASELYKQGYAPRILVSGDGSSMAYAIEVITEQGIPRSTLVINDQATSTYNEAQQVLKLLLQMDVESVLIITDKFHTRRALATYCHVFRSSDIDLTISAPDDGIDGSVWWRSKYRKQIAVEYIKMPYYWLNYGIWSG